MNKNRILDLVGKYKGKLDKEFVREISLMLGDVDVSGWKKGDRVNIVKSEYKGREGIFLGVNKEFGNSFLLVEFDLLGDNYKGKRKKKLFNVDSIEKIG